MALRVQFDLSVSSLVSRLSSRHRIESRPAKVSLSSHSRMHPRGFVFTNESEAALIAGQASRRPQRPVVAPSRDE